MNHAPTENNEQLEQLLYKFEQAWFDRRASFEEFLPPKTSADFLQILTELVRSDMEFRLEDSQACDAASYFSRFPELESNSQSKLAVVFEEYRLRNSNGDSITPAQLETRYNIKSTGWPDFRSVGQTSHSIRRSGKPLKKIEYPEVGDTFEDFELVGQLGEGAFGRVFLAQQAGLESRLVVLKFTSIKTDEHRLLARLQHTNIVPIYSVHRSGELQAICMPLLGIASLADVLRQFDRSERPHLTQQSNALVQTVNQQRELTVVETIQDLKKANNFRARQKLTADTKRLESNSTLQKFATQFICQTAEGLGYAHRRGIVHGDLKPANLLVDDDGNAVILDFHLGYSTKHDLGQHVGGTLPYMSPEHIQTLNRGEAVLEPTSDIYSVGVMLYEMLTGALPNGDELSFSMSTEELAEAKSKRYQIPSAHRLVLGDDLTNIVETCLEPDPKNRYRNGTELAADLRRSLENRPLRIASNGGLKNRLKKWAARNPRLSSGTSILAACSMLMAIAVGSVMTLNSKLNAVKAQGVSRDNIEFAKELTPALATGHGLHDSSFFETANSRATEYVRARGWDSLAQLQLKDHFSRLDPESAASESMAAAELHFWLAEVHRKPVSLEGRAEGLNNANKHNQLASEFWRSGDSRYAIERQAALIRAERNGEELLNDNDTLKPDNRLDRILIAYLLPDSPSRKRATYLKLAEENPNDFLSWLLLANSTKASGRLEQAEAYYTVCISIDHSSALPLFYRGLTRMEQRKLPLAIADFEQAELRDPGEVSILLNHALALGKSRKFKEALAKYDRAIELGASQTRVWYRRSQLRRALGDAEGAKADYDKFMKTRPTDELSCITRGIRKEKTSPEEAIEDYELALLYNSKSTIAYNNLAKVYSEVLNQTEKAIECMTKAVEIAPGNARFLAGRGVLFARLGERDKAIVDAEQSLRLKRDADTWYRVAGIYAQTSQTHPEDAKIAVTLLAKAAVTDPTLVMRMLQNDPDIVPIHGSSQVKTILDALSRLAAVGNKSKENSKKFGG